MQTEIQDVAELVRENQNLGIGYFKQLHLWLGISSAGGVVTMVSLASNLPDIAYALRFLNLSLWSFLLGIISAASSLLFLALKTDKYAEHLAASFNRNQTNNTIRSTPLVVSAPAHLAEESNKNRNALIELSKRLHCQAESAWKQYSQFKMAWVMSLVLSAIGFVFGFSWPLVQLSFMGRTLMPL